LLLDEIAELEHGVQAKVLRVLEDRTFQRVGGSATQRADVRLVAASNRDLGEMVEVGTFRSDLFYRLDVFPIELPALRDRASDVPDLARHLLAGLAARGSVEPPGLAEPAAAWLAEQPWPGNVRQLSNLLERALILSDGSVLAREELERALHPLTPSHPGDPVDEAESVRSALRVSGGDAGRAAQILGISVRTLQRRIRRHDLKGYPEYG
jgi:DNA-binding NtrC family response regulator